MGYRPSQEMRRYNHLVGEIDGVYHEMSRKLGLSDSAMLVLYTIYAYKGGCPLREICRSSGLSKQTVNSSIRALEKQGLICLVPGRGREVHLYLTERGRRLAEEKILPAMEVENQSLAELGEDAAALLSLQQRYLEIFRRRIRALIAETPEEN